MKKYLLIAISVLCTGLLSAQNVGIGTTNPTSKLEVVGNTKTTNLQLTTGASNLRILRSDAAGNGIWSTLDSLGGWLKTGNSGTTAGTNFLGTIDSVDLILKTNNFETARFLANSITAPGIVTPTDRLRITRTGTMNAKHSMSAGFQLGSYGTGSASLTQLDIALSNGSTPIPDTKVMTLLGNGRVGIGNTAPHGLLQFPAGNSARKIVLSETSDNNNQFFGFGVGAGNILKYQVDSTSSNHVFYAGVDTSSSSELMRITGTGTLAVGTATPNASAIGVFTSTTKGLLIPRMTTVQRDAIVSPATFLQILNIDDGCTDIYNGTNWIKNCGVQVLDTLVDDAHPLPDSWTVMANFGGTTRRDAVGFSIGTLGYIGTGVSVGTEKSDFWEYDSETNVWTQKASLAVPRHAAVGFSIGSKGFIGTGLNGATVLSDFWEYNPATNTWTMKANFGGGTRSNAIGVRQGTKAYVGTGKGVTNMDDFWEYNPATNTWTMKAIFPGGARNSAVGFAANGNVYVGTGINNTPASVQDLYEYNVQSNTWTQKTDFAGGLRNSAVGFSIGNKGYIGTGSNNSNVLQNDFWEYDPVANSWTAKANFTGTARNNAVGFSIGNKGYIGTGGASGTDFGDFREYLDDNTTGHLYGPLPVAGTDIISDGAWALDESTGNIFKAATGNVGIGNQTPHGNLQFSNGAVKRKIVLFERADNDHQFSGIGRSGAGINYQTDTTTVSHIFSAGLTSTTSNELMRITGTGNVGIGNATPLFSLVVQNDLNTAFSPVAEIATGITDLGFKLLTYKGETANVDGSIATQIGLAYVIGGVPNKQSSIRFHRGSTNTSGGYMSFTTGTDLERMRIDNSGNVGIGTTSPNGLLQFSNPNNKRKVVLYERADNTNQFMGFGRASTSQLTYQVDTTTSSHVFLAGANNTTSNELMRITGTGRVGIGVSAPDASLHVVGANGTTGNVQRTFFNNTQGPVLTQNTNTSSNVCIHAEGTIWADGASFLSTSDKRIKRITGISHSAHDLSILNQIEITDYYYLDTIMNGKIPQKKVIAQQLKEIYPSAVGQNAGVIPSVFALAEKQTASSTATEIVTGQAHGFSTGDQVKLILENKGELLEDVTVIDEHTFTVNTPITDKIFVYGKKVNDLLNVDYDAVAMLNVSATQELSKQIDILKAANTKLVAENETLKAESASTNTTLQVIQSRLTDLEVKLSSLLTPPVVQSNK